MKKTSLFLIAAMCLAATGASAYQLVSTKELGTMDAKNQNVVVKCTTDTGKVSSQTCALRRYAKCVPSASGVKNCTGWQPWQDLRSPGQGFPDWQSAAAACCRDKGLK
ncbi:MAG: hypothetical protein FWC51_02725 [Proteobacteria bacterium]|nr:hypothetical protein [Pseudomonadota bacterium]